MNQCDGCRAGIPLEDGMHRMGRPGSYADWMRCQRYKYEDEPMTDSMVDRGAAAIAAAEDQWLRREGDAKDGLAAENDMPLYEFMFRAAIAAMREPTEGMCDAGVDSGIDTAGDARECWQAMIDKALE